ncbi:sulfatase [Ideonella azotifigens]|uniref:Sulfatase n=1 Tax=Ideonella azotifigens TaxID=513160 RepID=A0ABN1JPB6_9BURK|nr:sulfatase [Ideonella azotifigens]MCD2340049.1 sulfatase [Ideonella azotifigens]
MIAIDDLNDWVGFLKGHPQVKTPNMDALAARSTVFERAYCNAPTCTGSRASALTGLSVQSTGVWDLDQTFSTVNPGKPMLWGMLNNAGYATQLYGKVDHNFTLGSQPFPTTTPYANKVCPSGTGVGAFDWGPTSGPDSDHPDYRFAQQGIDYLASASRSRPFFLGVGFVRTHVGWYVPQRFFDMYPKEGLALPEAPADDLDDLGPAGRAIALQWNFHQCITKQNLWADAVQAYLASISWVDEQIGRLIAALDASPHANNTMVVLWSDHGFHLGEKFHWHKEALWERSTHVPFLMRRPGQATSVRQRACVSLRDMVPTLLDYCRAAPAYPMDGVSLRPLIEQPSRSWDVPVLTTHEQYDHAIRTDQWRYIRYSAGERELYDESVDPHEYKNLAGDASHEPLMAQLDALMPPRPV